MRNLYLFLMAVLLTSVSYAQTTLVSPTGAGGFELGPDFASNGWTVLNGAIPNKWFVGTVPTGFTNNSAYISDNATGATHTYSTTSNSLVHFYRDVTFPAGETKATLSYKYRGVGESSYDLLQIQVAPTSILPVTSNATASGTVTGPLTPGATVVATHFSVATVTTFTAAIPSSMLSSSSPTTLRLIFSWRNDGSIGTQPPASIDDISLVTSLPATIQSTGAGGVWSAPSTWVSGNVPSGGDTAIIVAGSTVTIDILAGASRVEVNGTLDFNSTTTNNLTTGDLIVNASGTFNPFNGTTGRTINVAGNLVLNGTADFSKVSTALLMNGTTAQTISGSGNLGTGSPLRLLAVVNPAGVTISRPITITSTLNLVNGVLNNGTNLTIDNTVSPVATTVSAIQRGRGSLANPIQVGATATLNLAYLFFTGTTNAAVVEGNEVPASRTINALTISNALGVTFNNDLTMSAAATALTLTSGIVTMAPGKTLIFSNASYVGVAGSTTSFVNGGVSLTWGASATKTYPTGNNGQLRKAVFATAIGSGLVRVEVIASNAGTPGTGLTALSPARRWVAEVISGTITSYSTVALDYGTDDLFPASNTNRRVGQSATINGAYNSIGPVGTNSTSPVTSTAGTYTSLGFFALGLSTGTFPISFTNAGGNNMWGNPANWSTNAVPTDNDDVAIPSGLAAILTGGSGSYLAKSLVLAGGTLTSNTPGNILTVGAAGVNNSLLQVDGTLNISAGTIRVNGSVAMGTAAATVAAFNISGGLLEIAGNDGATAAGSVATGVPMLGMGYNITGTSIASTGLTLNGTGGTVRIVDHNFNAASTVGALQISVSSSNVNTNTLAGTTFEFGDGLSAKAGQTKGFEFDTYISTKRVRLGNVVVNTRTDLQATRFLTTSSSSGNGSDVERNLTVNTGSEIRTNGGVGTASLAVGGNIINNGTIRILTINTGRLFLGGVTSGAAPVIITPQTISGTGVFTSSTLSITNSIANMTVDNTGGVTLNVPLSVEASLTLTNGVVNTTMANMLTHGVVSSLISGTMARTNGFVNGPITRVVPAATTTDTDQRALFPVGTASVYRPAHINFTTAPTAGTLMVLFNAANPGTIATPINDNGYTIDVTNSNGYWTAEAVSGLNGGVYDMMLIARNFNTPGPVNARIVKRNGVGTPWTVQGIHVPGGVDTVRRSGMAGFSDFAVGFNSSVLPVTFTSIRAFQQNGGVQVEWKIATEVNVAKYEVERSVDGRTFNQVGVVTATGASVYNLMDASPLQGNNFYRIRAVNNNGTAQYTQVARVFIGKGKEAISVYPNPVTGNTLNVSLDNIAKGIYSIIFTNQLGQRVQSLVVNHAGGSANQTIDISSLMNGVYQMQVIGENQNFVHKIIKQ